jgi:cytochrome c oxidase cbb3-type subunit III
MRSAILALLLLVAASLLALLDVGRANEPPTTGDLEAQIAAVPVGMPPGQGQSAARAAQLRAIVNPFAGNAAAVQEGKRLFAEMNCAYCHDFKAKGLIGPSLRSHGWRYGATPAEVYKSIADGRPRGMPAWGTALPPEEIWRLVAYLDSLGGMEPPGGGPERSDTGAPKAVGH